MPIYEYEHLENPCALGKESEVRQSIDDDPLNKCPRYGRPVKNLPSLVGISVPKTNSELRDLMFGKLAKRNDRAYENVTARYAESRHIEYGKPETMPNLKKIISD